MCHFQLETPPSIGFVSHVLSPGSADLPIGTAAEIGFVCTTVHWQVTMDHCLLALFATATAPVVEKGGWATSRSFAPTVCRDRLRWRPHLPYRRSPQPVCCIKSNIATEIFIGGFARPGGSRGQGTVGANDHSPLQTREDRLVIPAQTSGAAPPESPPAPPLGSVPPSAPRGAPRTLPCLPPAAVPPAPAGRA